MHTGNEPALNRKIPTSSPWQILSPGALPVICGASITLTPVFEVQNRFLEARAATQVEGFLLSVRELEKGRRLFLLPTSDFETAERIYNVLSKAIEGKHDPQVIQRDVYEIIDLAKDCFWLKITRVSETESEGIHNASLPSIYRPIETSLISKTDLCKMNKGDLIMAFDLGRISEEDVPWAISKIFPEVSGLEDREIRNLGPAYRSLVAILPNIGLRIKGMRENG